MGTPMRTENTVTAKLTTKEFHRAFRYMGLSKNRAKPWREKESNTSLFPAGMKARSTVTAMG
ncbi:MAG: hypothetical protein BWY88_01193 [Synergistetes bacterium ADurb.Bin520]|nr:MAG: hypothetical protein BWY88_01193 [Synergistetes bacterium ADurb.Bin520]